MSRTNSQAPKYRYHKSGQAAVRLDGKDFYLGEHGTPESYARYYALLAQYNANGRRAPSGVPEQQKFDEILIKHIVEDFRHRVLPRYESNSGQYSRFKNLLDLLENRHGDDEAESFGPRKLEALRDGFVSHGLGGAPCCRRYCNDLTRMVVKIVKHGVSRELVSPERIVALEALEPLQKGDARETASRVGVPFERVRATLPHLSETVAAMVRLQVATAMRPSELFRMTPVDIDRSGDVWFYRPERHKTENHGKIKAVPILGDALEALTPFLFTSGLCFTTQRGKPWNKDSYRRQITRVCDDNGIERWTPYQIRHSSLQEVRDGEGPEAAQALAGHSRLSTTEIYAKANEAKAIQAAKKLRGIL